ncbi:MAG: hydrogenobyrinic acid a,c-diamide synthase (glutamine-hydrolyzing) [Thermodesulfovibrio sp.]|nr:hydrogenobyrinic acid a,c-diamide synthase (glutamine-hydrolyzing) [Thermodesulfovibrio sp.]MCX7723629.1 hydrogenobyrinic acid a,c-diamide synthase (glutamine-hydrolyzing) [Thermodesulfovibrio sp.]
MFPRVLISGIRGGVGKTTVTLAVISALREKGLNVIAFKKGPDYIDSGWLSFFSGKPCYNLDTFMIPKERIIQSFTERARGYISVIEGNRGLFDGLDVDGSVSSAELARLLRCPVILVIDCTKMTRSVAALINGFIQFERDVEIKAVVLNQLANPRHEKIIRESIEKYCCVEVVGAIPRFKEIKMPERHMGLLPYQEHEMQKEALSFIKKISDFLEIEKILNIAQKAQPIECIQKKQNGEIIAEGLRIGVIRDRVFQFYYEENLEELKKYGAQIVIINSIEDKKLPDIDALYIGGGFPETNVNYLSKNEDLMRDIRKKAEDGLPIYAECGGLMYLCKSLITNEGEFPMVGVFPFRLKMFKKPQAHGYVIAKVNNKNPFYDEGVEIRGHEFHYSRVIEYDSLPPMSFNIIRGEGIIENRDGAVYKNTLGTYLHTHALGTEQWTKGILKMAKIYKENKNG